MNENDDSTPEDALTTYLLGYIPAAQRKVRLESQLEELRRHIRWKKREVEQARQELEEMRATYYEKKALLKEARAEQQRLCGGGP